MGKWLILLLIGLSLTVVAPGTGHLEAQTTPDKRFGLTEVFWLPDEAEDLGVGWERILFYWRELQPEGPDDWNTLHVREEWLVEADSQGREVVGLIKNTAPWASEDGTEAGLPRGLYLPVDDPDNLWANFLFRLTDYYAERGVHHWIIWNEPEIEEDVYGYEFAGSAADYYQLLKTAYKVIKERDPQAVIHLAGLTYWHDPTFLDRLLAEAAADPEADANDYFFDVISLHVYFRTETIKTIIEEVNQIQARHGLLKSIWINETNAPPNRDPDWPVERPRFNVDLEQQASFIMQAFALGYASGAARISVYKLLDIHLPPGGESFGLVRPDGSRRPAYDAFKAATRCLGEFDSVAMIEDPLYYHIAFERPGSLTHVAWSRAPEEVAIQIPASAESATHVSLMSESSEELSGEQGYYDVLLPAQRCDEECLVGGEPLILVEKIGELGSASACVNFRQEASSLAEAGLLSAEGAEKATGDEVKEATEDSPLEVVDVEDESIPNPAVTNDNSPEDSADLIISHPTATAQPDNKSELDSVEGEESQTLTRQANAELAEITRDPGATGDGTEMIGLWFLAAGLGLAGIVVFISQRSRNDRMP